MFNLLCVRVSVSVSDGVCVCECVGVCVCVYAGDAHSSVRVCVRVLCV